MNRRDAYDRANWNLSDVQLARRMKVTKQAVAKARKVRGIPPAAGHGGKRKGAGTKPRKRSLQAAITREMDRARYELRKQ